MIASVRRWGEAGVDVEGRLRRLTWPVVRRWNAGFIAALMSEGVPVSPGVVAAARKALRALVKGQASDAAWYRYAGWYAEVDREEAAELLSALARKSRYGTGRYRAFVALHGIHPERAVPVGEDLVTDHRVRHPVRHGVLMVLAERDLSAALGVAERAAARPHHGPVRIEATGFVRLHDRRKAFDLSVAIASDLELTHSDRQAASLLTHDIDPARSGETLTGVVGSAPGTAERVEAMDNVHRRNPGHLAKYLDEHRWTATPEERLDFTRYLVERFGRGPAVLVDLASDRTVPVEIRLQALDIDQRAATPHVLESIITDARGSLQLTVPAIVLLVPVSPDSAFDHLHGIATDRGYAFNDRMRAVKAAVGLFKPQQKAALYRGVVTGDGVTTAELKTAAIALKKTDDHEGRAFCAELARRDTLSIDDRLWFVGKTRHREALDLLREFARDLDEDPVMRVRAAQQAASKGGSDDHRYLRTLAANHTVPYPLRKGAIENLPEADRAEVLRAIAHGLHDNLNVRLEAMIALGALEPELAAEELDRLADDGRLPGPIRSRARDAALQLRRPR